MLFLVPAVVGGLALLTGGTGVVAGAVAADKALRAGAMKCEADEQLAASQECHREAMEDVFDGLAAYGEVKSAVIDGPVRRLRDIIVASGRRFQAAQFEDLDELVESVPDLDGPSLTPDLVDMLVRLGVGVGAGTAARAGIVAMIGAFGVSSTGAPLAGLTGIAAVDATLAAIGGGSLAAGGGGVALGGALLGGVVAGPALMMVGLGLLQQSSTYETQVAQYCADVAVFAEQVDQHAATVPHVLDRIDEMRQAVNLLAELLEERIDRLESRDLNDPAVVRDFASAMALATALAALLRTPVFGADGGLAPESADAAADAERAANDAVRGQHEEEL